MVGFGHKQAWLAVRDGDAGPVMAALGLRDLGTVGWRQGIDLAYLTDDRLAVTPPLPGAGGARWLLLVGRWLMLHSPPDLAALSAVLDTEVQHFATHRVAEAHRWGRARGGVMQRQFEFVGERGEVTAWRGEPDPAERAIGLPAAVSEETDVLVSEDDVMRLAGAWSVAPPDLHGRPSPGPLRVAAAPPPGLDAT